MDNICIPSPSPNPLQRKELDIQQIGIRMMQIFQGIDIKLRGSRMVNITKCPGVPSDVPLPPQYSQLPCTEYFLQCTDEEIQPDVDTFFIPEIIPLIPKKRDREDIYWQLRLMHGCGLFSIAMVELGKLLQKEENGGHSHFVGYFQNSAGEIVQEKIPFEDIGIGIRCLDYEPRAIHLLRRDFGYKICRTEKVELIFGQNVVSYNVLVCKNQWILDLSGMQFKMRGLHGELVGRLEGIQSYLERFPASTVKLDVQNEEPGNTQIETLFKINRTYIERILVEVLSDILENRKWCNYCGKIINAPSLCGACRSPTVNYCDKWCQKSEWKGHKLFCGKTVKVREVGGGGALGLAMEIVMGDFMKGEMEDAMKASKEHCQRAKELVPIKEEEEEEGEEEEATESLAKIKITIENEDANISPKKENIKDDVNGGERDVIIAKNSKDENIDEDNDEMKLESASGDHCN